MSKAVFLISVLFFPLFFYAQKPTPIYIADDAPPWMHLMQTENPDVFAIQKSYDEWFKERPFEKNSYTNYYKRWMRWARPLTQGDGSLHLPAPEEDAAKEKQLLSLRESSAINRKAPANWTFVGPKQTFHTDGRTVVTWQTNIYTFDISPSNPSILYAGGESGGIWKTTDKGLNWTLLSQNVLHDAIGAIKIHPDDPNIVLAATRSKIIKTTNGGATWTTIYSANGLDVHEFAFSIHNTTGWQVVLAATNQGLLYSRDGGIEWAKTFTNQTWTVKFNPDNSGAAYCIRKNGNSADFMSSFDFGFSWSPHNSGLYTPQSGEAVTGAIIAVCPSKPDQLYAYFCGSGANLAGYIGVFKSINNGSLWTNTHPSGAVGNSPTPYSVPIHANIMASNGTTGLEQGFYDMAILVNPSNSEQLIAGGTSWFRSNDGGRTWTGLGSYIGGLSWSHPDIQWLAAVGNDLWIASDGGLDYSNNWAATIEARMNGISGSDMWGFDAGWNEDILVGGRYHNGNMAYFQNFPSGKFYRMGGAEAATGYVNPGPERKVYHSDIGGHILNGSFEAGVKRFPVGLFPNESYAYYANSEMEWHPRCWNIVFVGRENKLWKSTDGGTSFTALATFPGNADNEVYDIEISRLNPQIIYCSQWDGVDDSIWRSEDGGETWKKCTPLPLPNNNDRVKLALSDSNPNVLWVGLTYGSNGKKIYKTTDGGQTWTNLTTSILDNIRVSNILAQYGTDDGIYLGTDAGVFYRNNSHANWQPYSTGLPVSAETNRLKPFYRDGKIRNGCWGFGVWESPLFEPSRPQALIMSNMLATNCLRDTFQFDDHSAVLHAGASWQWEFPGAAWSSGEATRTPRAAYNRAGLYAAYLTLTTPFGESRDTAIIAVNNACDLDTIAGNALHLDGDGDFAAATKSLNWQTNTMSVTAWIKRTGTQSDRAGIVFWRGTSTNGIGFDGDYLSYHWNDQFWWWDSGLTVPQNEWVHVALVVESTKATLYLNGIPSVNAAAHGVAAFDVPAVIGEDPNGGGRYFNGLIDEVCIYNRALAQAEIREQMHLTKTGAATAGLTAYYQFNEEVGQIYDRVGVHHVGMSGDATRVISSLPVGKGASIRQTVTGAGVYYFPNTGIEMYMKTGVLPNGEICVTRIDNAPDTAPNSEPTSSQYWVIRNYGTNANFAELTRINFREVGGLPNYPFASAFHLYRRSANGEGATWSFLDKADKKSEGRYIFSKDNKITQFGQFVISAFPPKTAVSAPSVNPPPRLEFGESQPDIRVHIFPNPVSKEGFTIAANLEGTIRFQLFNDRGQAVQLAKFERTTFVQTAHLQKGAYFYIVENERFIRTGMVVVE